MQTFHFLNVGKGNCTIIDFHPSKRLSMIDIDNLRSDEDNGLTDPIAYLKSNFKDRELFRFVLTHPDMDHMSGLNDLAKTVFIRNFWDTEHDKTIAETTWERSPYNREDWERYLTFRTSTDKPICLRNYRDETSECCWTQDKIEILSPSKSLVELSSQASETDPQKYHHMSYVLQMEHAGTKVLFGGDASVEAWEEILNECGEEKLKSDIFLAPHHGSENNIHEDAFKAIAPDYVLISVAKGVDYDYDFYYQLAKNGVRSTKAFGTMKLQIMEDGKYSIILEKND